ncbi:hypothetical protein FD30_GL000118 [Levilactobacillus namurensis DSM 19117]|uniref:Uncharacterized protein n=2 Tax=Levilactobacillus namurensis TaxID=380393 RepID=A0A0R1KEP2_9LACO|nr:hypothetical protein [Levilactobacillus namurensis]PTM24944.1 hypothetical protein DA798_00395 [Lactobacillus sp. PFC-70]KRK77367.1 hypothetical protein FD30_GL000118 [Levilactobacillus namurensis DSM 19117]MCW3778743.1 hypothetical protein [Levilactobacillus namurensis]MDT7013125.1 hypothetical protein [Levilactobacillus namurensis]MDT7017616.1 hypothetical protein [Levilactobacillus namurensis]
MQTAWYVLSGIADLALLVFIFLWAFDYARLDKSKVKHKRHYGLCTFASLAATIVFMLLSGAGK